MTIAKKTILLISDNIDFQEQVLQAILSNLGVWDFSVSIQIVEQVTQAWEYLIGIKQYSHREHYPLPVLLLTDLDIAGLSALELLRWMKHRNLKDIPMIVMCSASDLDKVRQSYNLGATSYFVKGPHFEVLINLVKTILASISEEPTHRFPLQYSRRLSSLERNL